MKKILYLVAMLLISGTIGSGKSDERYNPLRPDGSLKEVSIAIEWDNPDLPPDRRESLKGLMSVFIKASGNEVRIKKQKKESVILTDDYMDLWKTFKKEKLWDLESNALTDPRPIGVPVRTFSLKVEGMGEKYLNVDVENSKSKAQFRIIGAVDALSLKYLQR